MPITVLKVGGSLLSLPEFPARLIELCQHLAPHKLLVVVGGGAAADVVRDWDRLHRLDPEVSHWLAIDALGLTARLVEQLVSSCRLARTPEDVEAIWRSQQIPVLEPRPWLEALEAEHGRVLPHDWSVTSDSIAAWIALVWPADRLVLAKSIDRPESLLDGAAVDSHFRHLLPQLPQVDWVNLRADRLILCGAGP